MNIWNMIFYFQSRDRIYMSYRISSKFLYSYAISIKTKTHMDIKCLDKKMKKKYKNTYFIAFS